MEQARHIEVQIFGDGAGTVIALGERDCSLQRRNQKVVEETPAPRVDGPVRSALCGAAERLGEAVAYRSAGTVEYVYDARSGDFYFLEVNTRLQVEHGVTEEVTGVDLVEWMVRLAAGDLPPLRGLAPRPSGHAVQLRLYAEDPNKQFQPATGTLTEVLFPEDARVETWVRRGTEIIPFYDPMLAKLIVKGPDRSSAVAALRRALSRTELAGLETNLAYLREVVDDAVLFEGRQTTRYLDTFAYRPETINVMLAGTHTTVQDYPGREGYWDIGVPPSGPMDDLAFRLGNRLLGNLETAAGLEMAVTGPTLRFNTDAVISLTGAPMRAQLDGNAAPYWRAFPVKAGSILRMGAVEGPGVRAYLCVRHGIQVPEYLGSRATFTLGQFGGHGGRALRPGDVLHVVRETSLAGTEPVEEGIRPRYTDRWDIKTIYGPHGAPDFFTDQDMEMFFGTDWAVHYNSSRTGVRLVGPKPQWARPDGGEAGLHPSNIHDNAYAIGTVDFTGDMPVILGPDGPSLGGFVCPATIVAAERWKIGQLRPGDKVRFVGVDLETANAVERAQRNTIRSLAAQPVQARRAALASPVLRHIAETKSTAAVTYRPCGDHYLLVEYGPPVLDINLRFRAHAVMLRLQERNVHGVRELTPGIRSLQVHYDPLIRRCRVCWTSCKSWKRSARAWKTSWCRHASCTCPCPGTTPPRASPSRSTCTRCAATPLGAPAISSSSAASTDWRASKRSRRSFSARATSSWAWATFTSGRRWPPPSIRATVW